MKENETEEQVVTPAKVAKSKAQKKSKPAKDKPAKAAKREKPQPNLPAMTGPGVEELSIPEIDEAAELEREAYQRLKTVKEEYDAAQLGVEQAALKHEVEMVLAEDGSRTYRYQGGTCQHLVVLKPKTSRVSVKDIKTEVEED